MDIEENEYIRTGHGISKVIKVLHNRVFVDNLGFAILKTGIVNHSQNIIDLIEVGDYVNGIKVTNIGLNRNLIFVEGEDYYFENNEIKSIVTKEQFSSVEYVF